MRIRRNVRYAALAAAAATALAATGCGAGEQDGGPAGAEERYYLSLGDSLTVGVQPSESGPSETSDGYTDILYRTLYDADSTLRHERSGCGGEDTTTFLEGGLPTCDEQYGGRSQIEVAEEFLADHEGEVELVTLTIGGNNFTRCVEGVTEGVDSARPRVDTACVEDGLERVETEAPEIASRLRAAAGPDTRIVAMTYYNPFLAAMLLEPAEGDAGDAGDGPSEAAAVDPGSGPGLGEVDGEIPFDANFTGYATEVLETMNDSLRSAYAEQDIAVADVEAAFDSTDFDVPEGGSLPANLKAICDYTWMCSVELGPDIHTNRAGAAVIAEEFAARVG